MALAPSLCRLVLLASAISLALVVGVATASGVADSYPVMVEDGEDGFLILNDDEVANTQLLKHLAGASKEEVEEIVDSNPQVQDMLLERIKLAVDKRKSKRGKSKSVVKQPPKVKLVAAGDNLDLDGPQHIHIVPDFMWKKNKKNKNKDKKVVYELQEVDEEAEEEEEGEDDDEMDDLKVAKLRAKLRSKAAKVFKIGAKFKAKLMKLARKKDAKKAKKGGPKRPVWPHFHYKVSTSSHNDEV